MPGRMLMCRVSLFDLQSKLGQHAAMVLAATTGPPLTTGRHQNAVEYTIMAAEKPGLAPLFFFFFFCAVT